jgi:hypothetical protein
MRSEKETMRRVQRELHGRSIPFALVKSRKHPKLKFKVGGLSRTLTLAATTRDRRNSKNTLARLHRILDGRAAR